MSWLILVILLFVVGLVLLGLELFVIPGFGVVGVLGIAALLGSVGMAWWKLGPLEAVVAFGVGAVAVGGLLWYLPRSRAAEAMVLTQGLSETAVGPALVQPGAEGHAATPLRPAGIAQFADREVDVVSEGLFVDAGTRVRVTRVEGAKVFVEPLSNYQGS